MPGTRAVVAVFEELAGPRCSAPVVSGVKPPLGEGLGDCDEPRRETINGDNGPGGLATNASLGGMTGARLEAVNGGMRPASMPAVVNHLRPGTARGPHGQAYQRVQNSHVDALFIISSHITNPLPQHLMTPLPVRQPLAGCPPPWMMAGAGITGH